MRKAREQAGLTQAEVADLVGSHRQTVYRWEQGSQAPDAWHLSLLVEALEMDARGLLRAGVSRTDLTGSPDDTRDCRAIPNRYNGPVAGPDLVARMRGLGTDLAHL